MKARAHLLTLISLLGGAALFVFILQRFDAHELWQRVRALDGRFAWILIVSGLRPVLRALAWLRCLHEDERGVGLFCVWRARVIGDAIGNLTTAGPLLAEPARLVIFSAHLPLATVVASQTLELFSYVLSACVVMLAGALVLLTVTGWHTPLGLVSAGLALGLGTFLLVAALVWWRRWSLIELLRKVGAHISSLHQVFHSIIQRLEAPLQKLQRLEEHHFKFYRQRPRDFAWVCVYEAGFHLFGVLEIWLTLHLLGVHTSWLAVFLFEAIGRFINFAFAFVPVRLGVDEASAGLLAEVLGLGSLTGVALAVYRKLRVLFWTAVGLLLLLSFYVQRKRGELKS
ncbi:MAG: flippase-like domain-containing protein [Acidobacteria bacterium]|nr:flippase-like domain-containing protein [Acidobacteriota bacterium]MBI3422231.1 flippase-like domain-containing protein [Acidobacteriota bacterium]